MERERDRKKERKREWENGRKGVEDERIVRERAER